MNIAFKECETNLIKPTAGSISPEDDSTACINMSVLQRQKYVTYFSPARRTHTHTHTSEPEIIVVHKKEK